MDNIIFIIAGLFYLAVAIMLTDFKPSDEKELAIKTLAMYILIISAIGSLIIGGFIA